MILIPIKIEKWKVFAYCRSEDSCDLLEWLSGLEENYLTSRNRLFAIIEKVALDLQGPRLLPHDICHQVDKEHQIYEFIAGKLRLLWFYSPFEKKVIICAHGFLKKSQKTKKKDIQRAVKIKKRYEKRYKSKKIKIIEEIE